MHVLIYGAGKSGIGTADLACACGAFPLIYDEKASLSGEELKKKLADPDRVTFAFGPLQEQILSGIDLCVMSPGVPTDIPNVDRIRAAGIPVIGEVELAYRVSRGTLYAITGTNGKTTTTSLLGKIMADHDADTFVVGNIGTPFTSVAAKTDDASSIVAEISSFQLETMDTFHPHISAILNITEDHLNRHHTMEEYIRVKESITRRQTPEDFCILNYEDEVLRDFGNSLGGSVKVIWFSSAREVPGGIFLRGEEIIADFAPVNGPLMSVNEAQIIGVHNYENIMAAAAMALCAGIAPFEVCASVRAFRAVPHRIEFIREKDGVVWYNDSKGTNPDAAIKGILAMSRPTFLIGGGYDKGSDYKPWIRVFGDRVKCFVLEGATREDIRAAALSCGFPEEKIVMTENMEEAMAYCAAHAEAGDAVLLSPACASWGEFKNYEERGDRFRDYVNAL